MLKFLVERYEYTREHSSLADAIISGILLPGVIFVCIIVIAIILSCGLYYSNNFNHSVIKPSQDKFQLTTQEAKHGDYVALKTTNHYISGYLVYSNDEYIILRKYTGPLGQTKEERVLKKHVCSERVEPWDE